MNEVLSKAREFMKSEKIDFLLVNSTNEFLVEYNELCANARYKLTNFSGSTGDALLGFDKLYLFVDGRYHIQADLETDSSVVEVVKITAGQKLLTEIAKRVSAGAVVGVNAKKNSQVRVEAMEKQFKIKLLNSDGIQTETEISENIEAVDESIAGLSKDEKISKLQRTLAINESILLTNLEDISYLYNLRDFSKPYSSKITAKALITKHSDTLFTGEKISNFDKCIVADVVYVDINTINAYDYSLLGKKARQMKENPVLAMRTIKTDEEINHLKKAFEKTDKAMFAIRDYIEKNDNLTEFDIAQKLEEEFISYGAKNLSFKSIVAIDKNSALAHYSKSSKDQYLKDGSLVLIDCGAYYEGGLATDITRVFVKGRPDDLQKQVYTTVLKAFLNCFNFTVKPETSGYEIDALAREIFAENKIDGFEFNHGLGHGLGINVHECPPNLSCNEIAKSTLAENMCFTIEPGLYNKEHFGVRLENSCYLKDGKINSFTKMCYDEKLIDETLLTDTEKQWLKSFEVM